MAQFSNVTYGSQFNPAKIPGSTGNIPYGAAGPYGAYAGANSALAALLAGGLRANDFQGPAPGGFGFTYTPTVNPTTNAAPSSDAQNQVAAGSQFNPPTPDELSTDPILQQIQAAGQRAIQDSRSAALANSENAIIGYGGLRGTDALRAQYANDPTNPILAALTDQNTAQAAQANPDSALARLLNQNTNNEAALNQNENARNLFYSSTRGNDLGTLANNYRSAQNDAAGQLSQLLGQANQSVLDAQQRAQDQYLNGLGGAWDRWLALQQLLGPRTAAAPAPAPAPAPQQYPTPSTSSSVAGTPVRDRVSGGGVVNPTGNSVLYPNLVAALLGGQPITNQTPRLY